MRKFAQVEIEPPCHGLQIQCYSYWDNRARHMIVSCMQQCNDLIKSCLCENGSFKTSVHWKLFYLFYNVAKQMVGVIQNRSLVKTTAIVWISEPHNSNTCESKNQFVLFLAIYFMNRIPTIYEGCSKINRTECRILLYNV